MNREVKLNSIQGGPFTTSQNRISFSVPSDGVYDLSESYVNLNCEISVVENETASGIGVYPMSLSFASAKGGGALPNVWNPALVKNCSIKSERQGSIENIRRIDQISNVLQLYNNSVLELRGKSVDAMTTLAGNFNINLYSLFRDINKVGVVKSKANNVAPIKIKLEDLFDFAHQAVELDTTKTGQVMIDLELQISKIGSAMPEDMKSAQWGAGITTGWANVTAQGDANEIVTTWTATNLNQSPLYVGQKLKVSATGTGGAGNVVDKEAVISSIEWVSSGADKGKLKVQFEAKWGDVGVGETFTGITVATEVPASSSISLNFGELVLKRLAKTSSDFDTIEYSTFTTEQDNGNGLTTFQKQYQVEGDSDAVVVVFPDTEDDSQSISDVEQFRLRLNNDDLTDRDVQVQSPLYYDRINMSMTQMGLRLKRLNQQNGTANFKELDIALQGEFIQSVIMNPLVQTPSEKLLQVNTQGGAVNAITLFKHLPRVFSY
jgi:hypothetical protein